MTIKFIAEGSLDDQKFIASLIWQCIIKNQTESLVDILNMHAKALNQKNKTLRSKNPTIKTLCKFVSQIYENVEDISDAEEAHERYMKEGGVSLDKLKKELNLSVSKKHYPKKKK